MKAFYTSMIEDGKARGEIPADVDTAALVSMLLAMFLGMGFYAGFVGVGLYVFEASAAVRFIFETERFQ